MMKLLPPLKLRSLGLELVIIALFAVYGMRDYLNFDTGWNLHGRESEWLTSSALYVSDSLHHLGYVPLWQPYWGRGEPTFDNPVGFGLHPFQTLPSVIFGYSVGIKLTVVLAAVIAGWGGWYLGRVLGFGLAARVLLGLLFALKGPMHTTINNGYLQLGMTQAYLPWTAAFSIAVVKFREQRYPVILLAAWTTLVFLGGNIYYTLPSLLATVAIIGAHLARRRAPEDPPHWLPITFDALMWRRLRLALMFTMGLAAITFLPVLLNASQIGRHSDVIGWGAYTPPEQVFAQLFTPATVIQDSNEHHYLYTMPLWFAALVFLLIPVLERALPGERRLSANWRIWLVGIGLLIFFTTWGIGSNALVGWAYEHLPLIGQWRVVNRMLSLTTFWVAVFTALWVDLLWKRIDPGGHWARLNTVDAREWARAAAGVCIGALILTISLLAMGETVTSRWQWGTLTVEPLMLRRCVTWIRANDDSALPAVYTRDYRTVAMFMQSGIRLSNVSTDYDPLGLSPTIFDRDLSELVSEWMIPYAAEDRQFWREQGWQPVADSPPMDDGVPCAWRNPNTFSYIFTIPYPTLLNIEAVPPPYDVRFPFDPALTTPVTDFQWEAGKITLLIHNPSAESVVLVAQEVAWPGWVVRVNGQPAQLESVGQLIGYVVPPNSRQAVEFEFTAPLLKVGAIITLLTVIAALLYLFRVDQRVGRLGGWRALASPNPRAALLPFKRIIKTREQP